MTFVCSQLATDCAIMISNASEGQLVPNPHTPMAFLPPELAFQITVNTYVAVGTTAILIWDILSHLSEDYRLLTRYRIKLPTVTYFASRISILLHITTIVIFDTAPIGYCAKFGQFIDWIYPFTQSSTSLLFVLRVWAIYNSNYIRALVAFTWLAVVGSTLTVGLGLEAGNIGTTPYCIYTHSKSYTVLTFIFPLVHDTFIFIVITWRLGRNMLVNYNLSQGVRMVIFGDYLPIFSKTLLQDGQMYYLTTLMTSLGTFILFYMPFAPSYKVLFSLPNIVLMNIMACRVYRNTKLGSCDSRDESIKTAQLRFNITTRKSNGPIIPLSLAKEPQRLPETQTQQGSPATDREDSGSGSTSETVVLSGEKVLVEGP